MRTEVTVGQRWKSKNPDPRFGYMFIKIEDILTRENAVVNFKYEKWEDDNGVTRTMRVDTIQKEYHLL